MAGRAGAGQHRLFDLPQGVVLEAVGDIACTLDDPHQHFEFGHGIEPPVVVERVDQPLRFLFAAHLARLGTVEHEFGHSLDEEIDPFGGGMGQLAGDGEDRLRFLAVDLAVAPAELSQVLHLGWRYDPVLRDLVGEFGALIAHGPCPFSLRLRHRNSCLRWGYRRGRKPQFAPRARTQAARSTDCPSLARRASTWVAVGVAPGLSG